MDFTPTYERKPTPEDEGTDWLYILPGKGRKQHRVEISVVPDKAHKIRIQHVDRDMGGKTEWVPIGRAKVPWALRDDYLATEECWDKLASHMPPTAQSDVAGVLISIYLNERVAKPVGNGGTGILEVHDAEALQRACGVTEAELISHPDTFIDGSIYVPWPLTEKVVAGLCRREPHHAVQLLAEWNRLEEEKSLKRARDGDPWWLDDAREGDRYARRLQQWDERNAETIRYLRTLLGGGSPDLAEDFLTLRRMYLDLVRLMPAATSRIRMVRAQVSENLAAEIEALVERPLPASAHLLGADQAPENGT
ncbi:hypothetical protein [Microbacterium sp. Marseille-Q6965]|uniref:hypothetical protein n=1 Tax=Microbacterium sp. Marseille-Q6965 TaxID=2965072 RepID=UPI0021B7134E|nr:hypothetical protein [Microbacterium sp. Marseille-Q6965]